jgi:membrane associated rhomboid family serine protease
LRLGASRATAAIAGLTALVSLAAMALAPRLTVGMAFIPARLSGLFELPVAVPALLTPLSSTLLHAGLLHLALNLVMLVWVGAQVERLLGARALILAYIIGAFAAAGAQWALDPHSLVPMIGASGAISTLFGIYALMFGQVKRITASPATNRAIHAAWLLAAWVVIQWMTAMLAGEQGMMLATPAHIGGFLVGLAMQRPLLLWRYRKA